MESILFEYFKTANLTKMQRKIAQYMVDNEYKLPHMSLMDVSRAVGVSDASVLRLVRMIGFEGYNDFKLELYEKLIERAGAPTNNNHKLKDRFEITTEEGFPSLAVAQESAMNIISSSLQLNLPAVYDQAVTAIKNSRRIIIYGRRGTRNPAHQFSSYLRYLFDNVVFVNHYEDVYPALAGADERDLFIFFCLSRFYETDLHICSAIAAKKIPLCMITDQIPSVVSSFASILLRTKSSSLSYFHSALGTTAIYEYIIARLSNDFQAGTLQSRLDYIDEYTEDERLH